MAAVSGRAGLFTINAFNPNITDDTHATTQGQKSGAWRLEFGKITIPTAATTAASVRCTVNTGVVAFVTPSKIGNLATTLAASGGNMSGSFGVATSGSFLSGFLHIDVVHTGKYSGQVSGMDVNYLVIGY